MIEQVMIFTPYGPRLEPETVQAVLALRWQGPLVWHLQRDNPYEDGRENITHQYQQGRRAFLAGEYDAMLVVESDIIPPPDTLERLAALLDEHGADVAYGVYKFRHSQIINVLERYPGRSRNLGESLSIHPGKLRRAVAQGFTKCSGGGIGCALIARRVLERFDFWHPQDNGGHCDTWFNKDVLQADLVQMAEMNVVCGHKQEDGRVLWPYEQG